MRWDEWISWDSPRLAPFRSRTIHTDHSTLASPTPQTPVVNAPRTGEDDLKVLMPELATVFRNILPIVDRTVSYTAQVSRESVAFDLFCSERSS